MTPHTAAPVSLEFLESEVMAWIGTVAINGSASGAAAASLGRTFERYRATPQEAAPVTGDAEWEQFKLRFFRDLGPEQRRIVLGGLFGFPSDQITTHADEARILNALRKRLAPADESGQGREAEDAARYREIARRWQHQKTSESELFLMTLRVEGDPTAHLDDIIDAARRARGDKE
jgi:hypothetical protein